MSPKLNEQSNEQIQAAVMEKDPITELFEVSNKHIQNLETKIGDFLKEHGIIADNSDQAISDKIKSYDGKIEGDTNNFEKIKTLKQTLDKEKKDIIKHHLVMKMISHTMVANSKDNLDLLEILKANDKKELFADVVKIKNQELTEYRKELYQIDQKYKKDIGYVEPKSREQNIADISSSLEGSIKKLAKNPDDNSAIEEFESSIQKSKELGVDKEVSEKLGKYLELSMQSGVLPLALMANGTLRKALPMLPSVIGVGVWARLMHGTMSDKASALGETALAIAPITGTYIAYEDAMKAEGTAEKVAAWTGFAVSAGFDAFSVFLVATGIGAPAAVGTQALKVTAKEAVKAGVKKLFSFFTKEKSKEFIKSFSQQAIKDTVEGMWNIISFKGLRETRLLRNNINKPFDYISKKLEPSKIKTFQLLEDKGFVKAGATERLKKAGTAEEMRMLFHESNQNNRPEDVNTLIKESEYNKMEYQTTGKNLDMIFQKLDTLLLDTKNTKEVQETLLLLKKQDEHIGNSMNILNEISSLVAENPSKENILNGINTILEKNKGKISSNLNSYIKTIIKKVNNGEDFSYTSLNFLELTNKLQGKIIQTDKNKDYPIIQEYKKLVEKGEIEESIYGYQGNYQRLLEKLQFTLNNEHISPENYQILLKGYLDIIKNSEKTGWGKIRAEINEKSNNIDFDNGYEYNIYNLLSKKSYERQLNGNDFQIVVKNIDFSMIHSKKVLELIAEKGFNEIKNINDEIIKLEEKLEKDISIDEKNILENQLTDKVYSSINLIGNINKNDTITKIFSEKFQSAENQGLLTSLADLTNSNIALLKLLPFIENKKLVNDKIIINIDNNTQIKEGIGIDKSVMTRENLDSLLRDIQKMGDEDYKRALDIIINKISGEKGIKDFLKYIESHDVAAKIYSIYPKEAGDFAKNIILGTNYSTEYKIKFLIGIKKTEGYKGLMNEFKSTLLEKISKIDSNKLNDDEYNQLIKDIDNIESFLIKESEINGKTYELSNQKILAKINEIKTKSKQYQEQNLRIKETLDLLLDFDRVHNMSFLRTQKTAGNITFKTKELIKIEIEKISTIDNNGNIIINKGKEKEYKKLKQIQDQVNQVLTHYEFNLFDPAKFNILKTQDEKINYIFNMINEQSGWKLDKNYKGDINYNQLVKSITKQLNSITNHFDINKGIIDGFISKILEGTNDRGLDVNKKIYLLKLLERANVIKPNAEQKLDYIIAIKSKDSSDLRNGTPYIKEYIKNLDKDVKQTNIEVQKIKDRYDGNPELMKTEMEEYINSIKDSKTPVSYESIKNKGKDFKEGRDYVIIDEKYYITEVHPYRYFITRLTSGKLDLKTKESYVELIADKSDFGGKTIKEYFNETKDIETKLLLTYHKDLKYEKESLELLSKYSSDEKYKDLIGYIIVKRNDLELIKGTENNKLSREYLKSILTKEVIEQEVGKKLSKSQFEEYREKIIKIILNSKDIHRLNATSKSTRNETANQIEYIIASKAVDRISQNKKMLLETINQSLIKTAESIEGFHLQKGIDNIYDKLLIKLKDNPKIILDDTKFTDEIKAQIESEPILNKTVTQKILIDSKQDIIQLIKSELYKVIFAGRAGLEANEQFKNYERLDSLKLAKEFLQNNKKLLFIPLIGKLIMDPTEAAAAEAKIADTWEKSPKYPEYLKAMEAGDITAAMKIKKEAINLITKMVLKDYIADFKDKYEARYLSKFQEFPLGLRDLTATIHEKLSPMVKDKTVKGRNAFAQSIYFFINNYYKENGKAEKYARKLLDKVEGGQSSPIADLIINMGKQSDIEAAKSPEQKKKEHEEFIRRQHEIQIKENAKQAKIRKEIDASQRNIDASQRNIDASQRNIDASQRNIDAEKRKQEIRIKIQNMMNSI